MNLKEQLGEELYNQVMAKLPKTDGKEPKLIDLNSGEYVAKGKYDADVQKRDAEISTLKTDLSTRDADLTKVKKDLTAAQTDAGKLTELQTSLTSLQTKYEESSKLHKAEMDKREYEYLVKDTVGGVKFTSESAKKAFINELTAKQLPLKDGKLLGFDDYLKEIKTSDPGAFVPEAPAAGANPPRPTFFSAAQTPAGTQTKDTNAFSFSFAGVRPRSTENNQK